MKIKKEYIEYLDEVISILKQHDLPFEKTLELKEVISEAKLLVPIIGAFSAGKSSLLNSFLGKEILLTGITPETAIATELYYSNNEKIEAVFSNDEIEIFEINELIKIKENAPNIKFLKIYVNSENLKKIEPFILVDMPGFESPYDEHNKAIFSYINKGAHYILLTSVEEGTLTRSMLRQINNIQEYGRDFSFFLSKANLRAASEVKEIATRIEEQIDEYLLLSKEVTPIYKNSGENLKIILEKINPENLFKTLFEKDIKNNFLENNSNISLLEKTMMKSLDENKDVIESLKKSLLKIEAKKGALIKEAKNTYSSQSIEKIVDKVGKSISESQYELVKAGLSENESSFKEILVDIVKNSLIVETKYSLNDISDSILNEFKIDLLTDSVINIDEEFYEKIIFSIKEQLSSASNWFKNAEIGSSISMNNTVYKIGTTILGITTNIISPIIEILIVFLPNIINFFSNSHKEKRKKEMLEQKINSEIIPSVKKKIRSEISIILEKEVERMITEISEKIENDVNEKKVVIENLENERNTNNQKINEILETLKRSKDILKNKYNNIL